MPSELSIATAHLVVRPPSFKVTIADVDYLIKPLPADEIDLIADAISQVLTGLQLVAAMPGTFNVKDVTWAQMAALLPILIKSLSHSIPRIIAAALRVDEASVEDNIFSDDRAEILMMVFEAEGTKFLLKKLQGLADETLPKTDPEAQPLMPEQPTEPLVDTTQGTGSMKSEKPSRKSKSTT